MVNEKAFAKINLTLNIGGSRDDGYHDIETVMMPVSLYDTVTLFINNRITVECDNKFVPNNRRNIACIAADEFFKYTGVNNGVKIKIKKSIPVGGGLGGGSADAAAVLRGLNRLYKTGLDTRSLEEIAVKIGADVPFLIENKTALCTGIGEIKKSLEVNGIYHFVICAKGDGVNTRLMYGKIDSLERKFKNSNNIIAALKTGDMDMLCKNIHNDFLEICVALRPNVEYLINRLIDSGASGTGMSGSGVCVFGLFKNENAARKAAESIRSDSFARYAHSL